MPLYALGEKRPSLATGAWIAPSADLIGDVRVQAGASIWFRAVIRADNTPIEIGAGANIQDGAMLHSDPGSPLIVGADATIGHHAVLHGCRIGDRTLIGMGATVLNNAIIGQDCLVGAGALITEGKVFPTGSLIIGAPARVVRPLSDPELASLWHSAEAYREKARHYAGHLRRVRRSA